MNTSPTSTPVKTRWGMRIFSCFFCGMTALGLLTTLSDPAVFPGACFFGIFAAMFIVLAKSPKDKPCILGREQGVKKPAFVIGCVAAAFVLLVIATPPPENKAAPEKPEAEPAAPVAQAPEATSPPPAPEAQQAESAPAPQPADPQPAPQEKPTPAPVEHICNLEQFGGISGEQLIAILGTPDEIADDEPDTFGVPAMRYKYNAHEALGRVEFLLVDDRVVYFASMKNSYPYHGKDKIFEQFGISKGKDCVKVTDMPSALCYELPSDKVDSIRLNSIDNDKFLLLTVHYDLRLVNEWHKSLNTSEKAHYQAAAECVIEGMLKSPKSAEFPWPDKWRFGANRIHTFASSYVDAKNPMGVEIRNRFTVIFLTGTEHPVYIEIDGKVILNDGYLSMDEVKARTARKHARGKKKK